MNSLWLQAAGLLIPALAAWAAAYLGLDLFLRQVAPPGADEPPPAAARRLLVAGWPYRLIGVAAGGAALGAQCWGLRGELAHGWGTVLAVGGLALLDLAPGHLLWRFTLRKQFPHLRPYL